MDLQATTATAGTTRRSFIRGVAQAGASTIATASVLQATGVVDLLADAEAYRGGGGHSPFAEFEAIAASSADAVEVPAGFRADVLISYGDEFARPDGTKLIYGYNNDFTAFMPLPGKGDEGLLFVNHEYNSPFFQHGQTDNALKTPEQLALERYTVGNSVLHLKRGKDGGWSVITSKYNRRITGDTPAIPFTGPLAGRTGLVIHTEDGDISVDVGASANGSVANCSGGITPWGTVLSCEENFQEYGPDENGWGDEYDITKFAKYGWVVEHDPYDPSSTPRKHTALGRFRHENTAFRVVKGKPFVLYMGDDAKNEGVYKFVSERPFIPGDRKNNLKVLEAGTLYIAKWEPEGRRRFAAYGSIRKLVEDGGDPTSESFTWKDYAGGGPTGRPEPGEQGFSSCDNLTFDNAGNLWVVTDISSSSLAGSTSAKPAYAYHLNNAVFMIPARGPNRGVAFRFANMPVEAEGTGPYFTPDGSTLFINVQHPGEVTPDAGGVYGDPSTYTSWWPGGNRTAGTGTPGAPKPSTVVVTRERSKH